jgi:hypothetical protein
MNFKFENIKKGPVSTVIGAILILIAFYLMIWTETTTGEALMVLAAGAAFLGLRSNRIDGPGRGKTITMIIGMLIILFYGSSCATLDRCAQKFGTGDTVTVTDTVEVSLQVPVPGDSLMTRLQLDSLLAARPGDTVYRESSSGKAQAKFWKDKYNNYLHAHIECTEDTIYIDKEIPVHVPCPDAVVLDPEKEKLSWFGALRKDFERLSSFLVLAAVFIFIIIKLFRI